MTQGEAKYLESVLLLPTQNAARSKLPLIYFFMSFFWFVQHGRGRLSARCFIKVNAFMRLRYRNCGLSKGGGGVEKLAESVRLRLLEVSAVADDDKLRSGSMKRRSKAVGREELLGEGRIMQPR